MAEDKKSDKDAVVEDEEDPRLEFMFSFLQLSMQLKPDKWAKLLGNKELAVSIFFSFLKPFLIFKSDSL
jgi:hypothetical protein